MYVVLGGEVSADRRPHIGPDDHIIDQRFHRHLQPTLMPCCLRFFPFALQTLKQRQMALGLSRTSAIYAQSIIPARARMANSQDTRKQDYESRPGHLQQLRLIQNTPCAPL